MLVGEFIEIIAKYLLGIVHFRTSLQVLDLQKEAFPQISGPDSRRLEFLDDLQHFKNIILVCIDIGSQCYIIDNTVNAASEVAVIIKTADDEGADGILLLGQIAVAELLLKALGEAFLD